MGHEERQTWASLARALGTTTMSLHTWRKMEGAPADPVVEEWRKFVDVHGLNKGSSKTLVELKVLIAQEELKRRRRDNEVADGKMVEEETVTEFLKEWVAKLDMVLTSELEVNGPPLIAGRSIVEVREWLVAAHDRIREATKRGLLKWNQGS